MSVRAVRGAVQIAADETDLILEATARMVAAVLERNHWSEEDLVSILFTATPDLAAAYPASGARRLGLVATPLMCATEIDVPAALPRVVRMLAHVETDKPRSKVQHVYLDGAEVLRPDLTASTRTAQ
jgi:chorismate mutase